MTLPIRMPERMYFISRAFLLDAPGSPNQVLGLLGCGNGSWVLSNFGDKNSNR